MLNEDDSNLLGFLKDEEFTEFSLENLLVHKGYINGPKGTILKLEEMVDEGIPVYEQRHAIHNHRNFRRFISLEKFEELRKFSVKPNDVIISTSGTVGKTSVIEDSDEIGVIASPLLILRINSKRILPHYLKYYFENKRIKENILKNSKGSANTYLPNKKDLLSIPFFVPSMEVQKECVEFLLCLDEKIKILREINEKFHNNCLEILNDCANKKYSSNFEDSNWQTFKLSDIATDISGVSGKVKKEAGESNQKYISHEDIFRKNLLYKEDLASVIFTSSKKENSFKKYDLLFQTTENFPTNIIKGSILMDDIEECYLSRSCFGIRLNSFEEINPLFLNYYLQSDKFKREMFKIVRGVIGSKVNIAKNEFMNLEIDLPSIDEQNAYLDFLGSMIEKEKKLNEELEKLEEYKEVLINKLFI